MQVTKEDTLLCILFYDFSRSLTFSPVDTQTHKTYARAQHTHNIRLWHTHLHEHAQCLSVLSAGEGKGTCKMSADWGEKASCHALPGQVEGVVLLVNCLPNFLNRCFYLLSFSELTNRGSFLHRRTSSHGLLVATRSVPAGMCER